jgi:hypothetical protein
MATVLSRSSSSQLRADDRRRQNVLAVGLLWVQGAYFLLTGVWPLVSIRSFQMVTGPKTDHFPTGREADHWLVMTAGILITSIALALLTAAWQRRVASETVVLAIASAAGLTAIDVIYVARGVIAPIYLLDAAIEVILLLAWAAAGIGHYLIPEMQPTLLPKRS